MALHTLETHDHDDRHTPVTAPSTPSDWRDGLPVLTGSMITLRELRVSDAADLLASLGTAEVTRLISPPPPTVDGFEKFIAWTNRQRAAGESVAYGVTLKGTDTVIGLFQVRSLQAGFDIAEWGFALGSDFWGTGIFMDAAQLVLDFAFDVLGVHRLEAKAAVKNGRGNGALAEARRGSGSDSSPFVPAQRRLPRPGLLDDSAQTRGAKFARPPQRRRPFTRICALRGNMTGGWMSASSPSTLPQELIAQEPPATRGSSRLLHLDRRIRRALPQHHRSPARVSRPRRRRRRQQHAGVSGAPAGPARTGRRRRRVLARAAAERRLEPARSAEVWEALMRPGQKLAPGARVVFEGGGPDGFTAKCSSATATDADRFGCGPIDGASIQEIVDAIGHVPLPPYIKRDDRADDRERYQTVFARQRGSIAAPTAGLHFTPQILAALRAARRPGRRDHAARRVRHVSARARRARRRAPARGGALRHQRGGRRRPSRPLAPPGGASSPSAPRRHGRSKPWRRRMTGAWWRARAKPPCSSIRLRVPRGQRPAHEFSPAGVLAAHARGRLRRAGRGHGRLRGRHRRAVSVLQLRRRHAGHLRSAVR